MCTCFSGSVRACTCAEEGAAGVLIENALCFPPDFADIRKYYPLSAALLYCILKKKVILLHFTVTAAFL